MNTFQLYSLSSFWLYTFNCIYSLTLTSFIFDMYIQMSFLILAGFSDDLCFQKATVLPKHNQNENFNYECRTEGETPCK